MNDLFSQMLLMRVLGGGNGIGGTAIGAAAPEPVREALPAMGRAWMGGAMPIMGGAAGLAGKAPLASVHPMSILFKALG